MKNEYGAPMEECLWQTTKELWGKQCPSATYPPVSHGLTWAQTVTNVKGQQLSSSTMV
jgi:hypothetical protein